MMCKYCKNTEEFMPFGEFETPYMQGKRIVASMGIDHRMNLSVCVSGFGLDNIIPMEKKINYCPICGRKL